MNTNAESKTKRYKIVPTMKSIKSTPIPVSINESISTTNSESDSDLKNKIKELLESNSGVKFDTEKIKIIMKQTKELKQKIINLIKKLEEIKGNKQRIVANVNEQVEELEKEIDKMGNTINLKPDATKTQAVKGGSITTSTTENKIKDIGKNIEKIKLLISSNTDEIKKIDIDTLNKNYDLFINSLQIFLDNIQENKSNSSISNIEEANIKINELNKSFQDLRYAFE